MADMFKTVKLRKIRQLQHFRFTGDGILTMTSLKTRRNSAPLKLANTLINYNEIYKDSIRILKLYQASQP